MRLVIARCVVDYEGRLSAHLPEGLRLIMVKADGCIAVHADIGAYKPLNWMNAPNSVRVDGDVWEVTNSKGELLRIEFKQVVSDEEFEFDQNPPLQKDGVEAHLQQLLAEAPGALGDGFTLVRREYPTQLGPVDLLCADAEGRPVAVEVKRRGEIDSVEQLSRYVECLRDDPKLAGLRGMLVAQQIRPQARELARRRELEWLEVDYEELQGLESDRPRLF